MFVCGVCVFVCVCVCVCGVCVWCVCVLILILTLSKLRDMLLCVNFIFNFISALHTTLLISQAI